jgi:hypothetical protein
LDFSLFPWRFCFTATDALYFPAGQSGNIIRGAFGTIFRSIVCIPSCPGARVCDRRQSCAYAQLFEPGRVRGGGPSGLAEWPRPFVFRASHLDGVILPRGDTFYFDVHVFDVNQPLLEYFVLAFGQLARDGLGPGRGTARLDSVWQLDPAGRPHCRAQESDGPLTLTLHADQPATSRVRVEFVTPTELKPAESDRPEFRILFSRVRDRISTLRQLYGAGPLLIDFRQMAERAAAVQLTHFESKQVHVERRSSRTRQVHPIGGMIGTALYEGDLTEVLPFLRVAQWTGVGRQTVWGKGQIVAETLY